MPSIPIVETQVADPGTIALRQADSEDLAILLNWTLCLHQHEDDGQLEAHPQLKQNLKTWLASLIEEPQSLLLIAEIDQQPAGFIAAQSIINDNGFLKNPLKGLIQLIWVDSNYRQLGIASLLLETAEACFRDSGIRYVEANFTTHNQLAEKFWRQKGYKPAAVLARKFL